MAIPSYEAAHQSAGLTMKLEYVGAKDNSGKPRSIDFFAYLQSYSDVFEPEWEKKKTFGRTDPLVNYNGTSRKINVTFNIPAYDIIQARDNLSKLSRLASFTYPVINSQNSLSPNGKTTAQFQAPPILRFSFGNLIRDYQTNGGLYGFIDSAIDINWKLEFGVFISSGSRVDEPNLGNTTLMYPKIVEMTFQYQVLHNHTVGWDVASTEQYLDQYGLNRAPPDPADLTGGGTISSEPETTQVYGREGSNFSFEAEQFTREPRVGNRLPGDYRDGSGKYQPWDIRNKILDPHKSTPFRSK